MSQQHENYPQLTWKVVPSGGQLENAFTVDLGRLAFGQQYEKPLVRLERSNLSNQIQESEYPPNLLLTLGLAPSLQEWSTACRSRTVAECLFNIKWFYRFVHEATVSLGILKPSEQFNSAEDYISSFDRSIGVAYAGWLKNIHCAEMTRTGRYAVAKILVENARDGLTWRSNPFDSDTALLDASPTRSTVKPEQIAELLAACREVVRSYKERRKRLLRSSKRDPLVQAARETTLGALPDLCESMAEHSSELTKIFVPGPDIACACFIICLIQLGCNEQPLRELRPGSAWWRKNPFSEDHRLINLEKNRAGGSSKRYKLAASPVPKTIKVSVKAKPQYHPFKILRYYELLSAPVRAACGRSAGIEENETVRARGLALSKSFWSFIGTSGKAMSLTTASLNQLMNEFLGRLVIKFPSLQDKDGTKLKYSAKEFRDAYFEFTLRKTSFDTPSGQAELGHSPDSKAIRSYLNRVWTKQYSRDQYRVFQNSAFSTLRDTSVVFSPSTLKTRIEADDQRPDESEKLISAPPRYKSNQVRHGLFCDDPGKPPSEVYIPEGAGDVCPAEHCWRCSSARCYDESLAELALDMLAMKRERDECAPHIWIGSEAELRLNSIEEVFRRWPKDKQEAAISEAERLSDESGDLDVN